jgi:glycosyltransferase involved in cell wall biosynthesis
MGHRGARRRVHELIAGGGYDVVHAHGLRAGMDTGTAARSLDTLRVVTVHNLVREDIAGPLRARVYRRAEKLAVKANDRVLAVSRDIATHLRETSARSNIEVFHLGIEPPALGGRDLDDVRAELGVPKTSRLAVCVARLDRQKALHVLIDAVALLEHVTVAVVGTGPLRKELEQRASQRGVSDRFRLLGWRKDVLDVVSAADVFCLSSVWEGVPLAAQEAMAVGTPVVATDVGGMSDLIEDGVSGRLVPPGRAGELAGAIAAVLDDASLSAGYVHAARQHLEQEFSMSRMVDRLRALYSMRRD